jgi:hypothetical protein
MMSNTVGAVRMMLKDLPDDMEIVVEDSKGHQYDPCQCGLSRVLVVGPRAGSYVFDGEAEEKVLGSYDDACFMLRCS